MTSATEIDGANAALAADEEGLFSSEFSNVALAGNNISLEMLQLATEVYGPDRQISSAMIRWCGKTHQATTRARRLRSPHKQGAGTRSRQASSGCHRRNSPTR